MNNEEAYTVGKESADDFISRIDGVIKELEKKIADKEEEIKKLKKEILWLIHNQRIYVVATTCYGNRPDLMAFITEEDAREFMKKQAEKYVEEVDESLSDEFLITDSDYSTTVDLYDLEVK